MVGRERYRRASEHRPAFKEFLIASLYIFFAEESTCRSLKSGSLVPKLGTVLFRYVWCVRRAPEHRPAFQVFPIAPLCRGEHETWISRNKVGYRTVPPCECYVWCARRAPEHRPAFQVFLIAPLCRGEHETWISRTKVGYCTVPPCWVCAKSPRT
jgi:hypothetical protein